MTKWQLNLRWANRVLNQWCALPTASVTTLCAGVLLHVGLLQANTLPPEIPRAEQDFADVELILGEDNQVEPYIPADLIKGRANPRKLRLNSHVAAIFDERDGKFLYQRGGDKVVSIASLTKLMTAMVILDAKLPMDEIITITRADKDLIRYSKSRLAFGTQLMRYDLLLLALLASENRAALALSRTYPGGTPAFVAAMNRKARDLGLQDTRFRDAAGLDKRNMSTAKELTKLGQAAANYPLIRYFTTLPNESVTDRGAQKFLPYSNTNLFVRRAKWDISMSKTGFTTDAGNCLLMRVEINERPLMIVLLNSWGKSAKYGDSNRIKTWLTNIENLIEKSRAQVAAKEQKIKSANGSDVVLTPAGL